jgi:hypothetical protein
MSSIKIDPSTGDLAVENNSLVLLTDTSDETRQRLTSKFKTYLGEWFLNNSIGIPYFEDILIKNPDLGRIRSIFREVIINDEQVQEFLSEVTLDLNTITRVLTVSFEVLLNNDEVLDYQELILEENV